MAAEDTPRVGSDPGHPDYDTFTPDVDQDKWSRVREGQSVVSATGERLGKIREKSPYTLVTEAPRGFLSTQDLYIPHVAVDRVDGDTVHLGWTKAQLAETYDHYRAVHFPQFRAGVDTAPAGTPSTESSPPSVEPAEREAASAAARATAAAGEQTERAGAAAADTPRPAIIPEMLLPARPGDPGHPTHDQFLKPVDPALWSSVHDGQHVISASGDALGRVHDKAEYTFVCDAPRGLFSSEEIYVPYIAVDRVEGDRVHLAWTREQLLETYEHYRRWHFPATAGSS